MPSVAKRLPPLVDFVCGREEEPRLLLDGTICDPNTGDVLQPQRATEDAVIEEALAEAARVHAQGGWRDTSIEERARALDAVAQELEQHRDALSFLDAQTTGVVISLTQKLAAITIQAFRTAAQKLRSGVLSESYPGPHGDVELVRKPIGPVAIIAPWNAPTPITAHKLASALAAGCPVVMKPSEWSPHSADLLVRATLAAGLPKGLVQLVHGSSHVGGKLVKARELRAVSFTGGLYAGRAVAEECARQLKPCQLELGGNNALLVLEDANLEQAANGVVTALTTLNAQWCRALGRLLVHERVRDALLTRVLEKLQKVRLNSSLDVASDMGPIIHRGHLAVLERQIATHGEHGGVVHQSTERPELLGNFLPPTLITDVPPELALDEMFGPVCTVHPFRDDQEAVFLANQPPFGLAGYVFSASEPHAFQIARRMETGMVKINGVTMLGLNPDAPRPAWKQSGLGHEGASATIEFFCGETVIGVAARD